jgi:hypothetical protein
MSQTVTFNGVSYTIPDPGDEEWGQNLTNYFVAIPSGALQKTGGNFTLTANVNFGATYGLLSKFFSSRTANSATAGVMRFANTEGLAFRNAANSANKTLVLSAGDVLTTDANFAASNFSGSSSGTNTGDVTLATFGSSPNSTGSSLSGQVLTLQPADNTNPGGVSVGAQTFGGLKTFRNSSTCVAYEYTGSATVGVLAIDSLAISAGNRTSLDWRVTNSTPALITAAQIATVFSSITAGSERSNLNFYNIDNTGAGLVARMILDYAGGLTITGALAATGANFSGLTASYAVVTDGSKNLASLQYTNSNTVSTLVQRDSSGNFSAGTITAALTGTASGNTTYTPNQYGVVLSGAANTMSVLAPDASTSKVLTCGGASANPSWQTVTSIISLTASRAVITDSSGNLASATTTSTEIGALVGVSSNVQTQLNAKSPIASPTFTGTVTIPTPFTLGAVSVTSTGTQLNYLAAATGTTGTTSTNLVFSTSPTLVTPTLGVASATTINKVAFTAPASGSTLTIADGKTLTASNTITFTATDGSTLAIGAGGTLGSNAYTSTAYAPLASPTFTGTVTIPTPFTLGATSVTATGTQLNYLAAATGTTGTTSSNVVYSASPTFSGVVTIGSATYGNALKVGRAVDTNPTAAFENNHDVSGDTNTYLVLGNNCSDTSSFFLSCFIPAQDKAFIYGNGTFASRTNTYGGISDATLKENIIDTKPKLADLMKVRVVNYNLIDDEKKEKQLGVISQELEQIFPGLVFEGASPRTKKTKKHVKYSVFTPILIKALQELTEKVYSLENQLNAMKGNTQ